MSDELWDMWCLQATEQEDSEQLKLPLHVHVQVPYQRDRQDDDGQVAKNVDGAGDGGGEMDLHTCAGNLLIPRLVDRVALEDAEECLGDVVGENDRCNDS